MNEEKLELTDIRRMYEERMALFIAAVVVGSVTRKNTPSRADRADAAREIVAFAEEIEAASRRLFEER